MHLVGQPEGKGISYAGRTSNIDAATEVGEGHNARVSMKVIFMRRGKGGRAKRL